MVSLTLVINVLSVTVLVFTIAGTIYGFWRGDLQNYLQRALGITEMKQRREAAHEEMRQKWEAVDTTLRALREDHEEAREDLDTIKTAQVDIGRAINEGEEVDLEELEERHWGDDARSGDFLRGGGGRDVTGEGS